MMFLVKLTNYTAMFHTFLHCHVQMVVRHIRDPPGTQSMSLHTVQVEELADATKATPAIRWNRVF